MPFHSNLFQNVEFKKGNYHDLDFKLCENGGKLYICKHEHYIVIWTLKMNKNGSNLFDKYIPSVLLFNTVGAIRWKPWLWLSQHLDTYSLLAELEFWHTLIFKEEIHLWILIMYTGSHLLMFKQQAIMLNLHM